MVFDSHRSLLLTGGNDKTLSLEVDTVYCSAMDMGCGPVKVKEWNISMYIIVYLVKDMGHSTEVGKIVYQLYTCIV